MDGLQTILVFFLGLVFCSHYCISESVQEVIFSPGENITLYCDCKASTGVFVVWFFRNCSLRDQTHYVLNAKDQIREDTKFPRLKFLRNDSSESYDLLVINATNSDVGFYYCGTEETKVEIDNEKNIVQKDFFTYGNISTTLILDSSVAPSNKTMSFEDCGLCWKLLFSLCPAVFIFSTFLTSIFGFLRWKAETPHDKEEKCDSVRPTEKTERDDVCFAALDVHLASQKKKKRMIHRSDFCIFTVVIYNMKVED